MVAKQVADLITFTRLLLGISLVWIGFEWGEEGLSLAIWLVILNWTGDLLDGRIARRSRVYYHSWIGDHDLEVDMLVSVGLLFYLVTSGYFNGWIAIIYILLWGAVFWNLGIPRSLGMLFQAPIYGVTLLIALQHAPQAGHWMIVWILLAIIATWPLFPKNVVPDFLDGIRDILPTHRNAGRR